jgi:YtcA family
MTDATDTRPPTSGNLTVMGSANARGVCPVAGTVFAATASLLLPGCERVPSVDVLGAFFPSWMLCIVAGVVLTLVGRYVLVATGLDPWVGPRGLVYPALALAFTLATWLTFFRG